MPLHRTPSKQWLRNRSQPPAITAPDTLVRLEMTYTNFSGAWSVPYESYRILEGTFADIQKYFRSSELTKIKLINAFNKSAKRDIEYAMNCRNRGFSSPGYETMRNFSDKKIPDYYTQDKIENGITFYKFRPKSAF